MGCFARHRLALGNADAEEVEGRLAHEAGSVEGNEFGLADADQRGESKAGKFHRSRL